MISPAAWALVALITIGCAVGAFAIGSLLMRVLHHRSVTTHLVVVSFAAIVTVAASIVITTKAMFLSANDSVVVLLVILLSVPAGAGVAVVLGRSLRAAARKLADAAVAVGDTAYDAVPAPVTTELGAVAAALDDAHRRLAEARMRADMLEQGRRELIAWMSHDLRTPWLACGR